MVVIDISGTRASVQNYEWVCDSPAILAVLNSFKDPDGPGGADPYPDLTLARKVEKRYPDKVSIISYDEPGSVEGEIH